MNLLDDADDPNDGTEPERPERWHLPRRVYSAGIGCMTGIIVAWTMASCVLLAKIDGRPWWACAVLAVLLVFCEIWLATWIVGRDER